MIVHLIDGTYELFRHFYAVPPAQDRSGVEIGAVRGVVGIVIGVRGSRGGLLLGRRLSRQGGSRDQGGRENADGSHGNSRG